MSGGEETEVETQIAETIKEMPVLLLEVQLAVRLQVLAVVLVLFLVWVGLISTWPRGRLRRWRPATAAPQTVRALCGTQPRKPVPPARCLVAVWRRT